MTTSAAEVAAAIDEDLANLRDPRVRADIMAFRVVPPAPIRLAWDYGQPGETFGGWLVFSDPRQRTGIAYCDQGFGPKSPWGLIATGETCPSTGMDSGWFQRFMDAWFDSFSAADLPMWKVIRRNKDKSARERRSRGSSRGRRRGTSSIACGKKTPRTDMTASTTSHIETNVSGLTLVVLRCADPEIVSS